MFKKDFKLFLCPNVKIRTKKLASYDKFIEVVELYHFTKAWL